MHFFISCLKEQLQQYFDLSIVKSLLDFNPGCPKSATCTAAAIYACKYITVQYESDGNVKFL